MGIFKFRCLYDADRELKFAGDFERLLQFAPRQAR